MPGTVVSILWFGVAALFELSGCFAFWAWLRQGRSPLLALAGVASLILFALALTRVEAVFAGRAFAAYGGIYIVASLLWFRLVEHVSPDRWDIIGGVVSLAGACVIIWGPHA